MLSAREVYQLATAGLSVKQIREIEVRRADPDRLYLTPWDVRFLTRCGVRVQPHDLLSAGEKKKKDEYPG